MSGSEGGAQTPETPGRQPIFLLPGSVAFVAGLFVAVHLALTFALDDEARLRFTIWFGFLPYRITAPGEIDGGLWPLIWTPVTHAFLHAGWDHLLVNTAWFAIFATPVARRYGGPAMVAVFLISTIAGAALFGVTTYTQVQILIGASGGVAGLTGAASRFIFQPVIVGRHPVTGQPVPLGRRIASLGDLARNPRARFFIIIWTVLNAAVPLLPALTGTDVQIAWQAHLGGFFAGLLVVGLFERRG